MSTTIEHDELLRGLKTQRTACDVHGWFGMAGVIDDAIRYIESIGPLLNSVTADREWNDRPTEHDAEIAKAHPTVSKQYDRYRRALEMVEDRNSKYALVDLVNWLLARAETPTIPVQHLSGDSAPDIDRCLSEIRLLRLSLDRIAAMGAKASIERAKQIASGSLKRSKRRVPG